MKSTLLAILVLAYASTTIADCPYVNGRYECTGCANAYDDADCTGCYICECNSGELVSDNSFLQDIAVLLSVWIAS